MDHIYQLKYLFSVVLHLRDMYVLVYFVKFFSSMFLLVFFVFVCSCFFLFLSVCFCFSRLLLVSSHYYCYVLIFSWFSFVILCISYFQFLINFRDFDSFSNLSIGVWHWLAWSCYSLVALSNKQHVLLTSATTAISYYYLPILDTRTSVVGGFAANGASLFANKS